MAETEKSGQKRPSGDCETGRYKAIFEAARDAIFVADTETGIIIEANAAAAALLMRPLEEIVGMHQTDLHPEGEAEKYRNIFADHIQGGAWIPVEAEVLAKGGHRVPVEITATEALFPGGKKVLAGVFRDIRERKREEEERARLQAQLQQAQKMESVGTLAGGVAHDFNNMLGVILGHAEMALEDLAPGHPVYEDLLEIQLAAGRSADLTRRLLAFARRQTVSPEVLEMNETIAGMLKMLKRLIGEHIELRWNPGQDLGRVEMDPAQMDQILANLLVNSRDAIVGNGEIFLETRNVDLDESWCGGHPGAASGSYVMLAVSDTGAGMSREVQARVFEPFFTTKEMGKGTGLGLAMVYGIVKQNSGYISVYSEPGHGATVNVYLPRVSEEGGKARERKAPVPATGGSETVLLVEDEEAILNLTRSILERQGYSLLTARLPTDAIELVRSYPGEIHLLVSDVVMPRMNGRELLARIKEERPNMKALFMSGYTADLIAHHGVLDPGVFFIQKPFSMKQMAAKAREVLDGRAA